MALGSRRNLHFLNSFQGWNFDGRPQNSLRKINFFLHDEIISVSAEDRMLPNRNLEIGTPGGTTVSPLHPLPGKSQFFPCGNASWNFYRNLFNLSIFPVVNSLLPAPCRFFQRNGDFIDDVFSLLGHSTHILIPCLPAKGVSKIKTASTSKSEFPSPPPPEKAR